MKRSLLALSILLASCSGFIVNKHSLTSGNFKKPGPSVIDVSGVMIEGNHKGWLYDSPSRRVVVTCTHTGPAPGRPVSFKARDGSIEERKIVKVYKIQVSMHRGVPLSDPTLDNLLNSDTSVCVIDSPVSDSVKAYPLANGVRDGDWVFAFHQDSTLSVSHVSVKRDVAIATRSSIDRKMIPGDSGLPWFGEDGSVVSHTTLVDRGYGPLYTHDLMEQAIRKALQDAEAAAQ